MPRVKDRPNSTEIPLQCSFCRRREDQVERLIAGPGVYICDGCVAFCRQLLEQEN